MTDDQKTELLETAEALIDRANAILIMINAGFIVGLMDTSELKPRVEGNVIYDDRFGGKT